MTTFKFKPSLVFFPFFIGLLFSGCKKDDVMDEITRIYAFDGTMASIRNFVTPTIYGYALDLGFIFHEGNNPPNVEGVYYADSKIIVGTNVPNEVPGSPRAKETITLSNQNTRKLSINLQSDEGVHKTVGYGSYVSGYDDNFTILFKTTTTNSTGEVAKGIRVISGTISPEGIRHYKTSTFIVDNGGRDDIFIPNNTGRVIEEFDGLAIRL